MYISVSITEVTKNKPEGWRMSESGNSSKLEVSSMLLISMGIAAGLSLERKKKSAVFRI